MAMTLKSEIQNFKQLKQILCGSLKEMSLISAQKTQWFRI